ncbi:hypothetical protein [Brachyspira sp.]|uniref:hypothetical protein n=1 Tax=Brachyspira sp. TaxID=1977261 RepID=UPI003D7E47FA
MPRFLTKARNDGVFVVITRHWKCRSNPKLIKFDFENLTLLIVDCSPTAGFRLGLRPRNDNKDNACNDGIIKNICNDDKN